MKQHSVGFASLILLTFLCNYIECGIIIKRQIIEDPSLNPEIQEIAIIEDEDRDKRAVGAGDGKFALKNALLGFVFNPIQDKTDRADKPEVKKVTTTTKRPTTTDDIVIFEKNEQFRLDVPSELIGSGFTFVTKLSTTAGDYMMNSALRFQRFLEVFRPALRFVFGAKGVVIDASTDKPLFSDASESR